jgi:energy-coupling factor transporter ATP-binding protein EcfA2
MASGRTPADIEAQVQREWDWPQIVSSLARVRLKPLTTREQGYLQALLCYVSPQDIADIYHSKPATVTKALSEKLYGAVNQLYEESKAPVKVNWQMVPRLLTELGYRKGVLPADAQASQPTPELPDTLPSAHGWSGLPEISFFVGRETELTTLEAWIVQKRARLVSLTGQGGIGKTTLVAQLGCHLRDQTGYAVCWRSLRSFANPLDLLVELLTFLHLDSTLEPTESVGKLLPRVMTHLQQQQVLIVLDDIQDVLGNEASSSDFRPESAGYEDFFNAVMQTPHQSCLILISWEEPQAILRFKTQHPEVKSQVLKGLTKTEAHQILVQASVQPSDAWDDIIMAYRGNPYALTLVLHEIKSIFQGDVEAFLEQNTMFLGDLKYLIRQQLQRLSPTELEVAKYLSTASEPLTHVQICEQFNNQIRKSELMYALEQLLRRSLLEKSDDTREATRFNLQPVIRKYVAVEML